MKPPSQKKLGSSYSPAIWSDYYDSMEYLEDGTSVFIAGNACPVFLCVHGAGHSA